MAEDAVRTEMRGEIAVITLDDGKANALSPDVIAAIHAGLDRAEREARAVVLVGRPGRFSAGFDLGVLRSGPEAMKGLVTAGAELCLRCFGFEKPVVSACTGHAIAAGALLLLSSDARIAAEGDFKLGLNEVAIGMTLPIFACELARARLSKRHFDRALTQGLMYPPGEAVDAGYVDAVTAPERVLDAALAEARRLGELPQPAFANTKQRLHATAIAYVRETLAEDMEQFVRSAPSGS